jgi:hypothetical protein
VPNLLVQVPLSEASVAIGNEETTARQSQHVFQLRVPLQVERTLEVLMARPGAATANGTVRTSLLQLHRYLHTTTTLPIFIQARFRSIQH